MTNPEIPKEVKDTVPADSDVKPRGPIEYADTRTGIVHFFENDEELIAFLEEQRQNSN